jgi:DNA-binding transcriptional regulator/RsmH inhibitor MraZ
MSDSIMMTHPKLKDSLVEVTPEQFEIWKESGWKKASKKEIAEDSQKLEEEG